MLEEDEFDQHLINLMDEVFKGETSTNIDLNINHLFEFIKPTPKMVPKILNLKPSEFMEATIEHFQNLCKEHKYAKIISSLTYIRNVASGGDEKVIQKAKDLQEDLKRWRTTSPHQGQNTQDDQTAGSTSSETSQ